MINNRSLLKRLEKTEKIKNLKVKRKGIMKRIALLMIVTMAFVLAFSDEGDAVRTSLHRQFRYPVANQDINSLIRGNSFNPYVGEYGLVRSNSKGYAVLHEGLDISGEYADPLYAVADGKVIRVDYDRKGYGKLAMIEHEGRIISIYAHMTRIDVKRGQRVKRGDLVGRMGRSGNAIWLPKEETHVHLELARRYEDVWPEIKNPYKGLGVYNGKNLCGMNIKLFMQTGVQEFIRTVDADRGKFQRKRLYPDGRTTLENLYAKVRVRNGVQTVSIDVLDDKIGAQ